MKRALFLRSALFNLLFFGWTIFELVFTSPVLLMPQAAVRAVARSWARVVFVLMRVVVGLDYEVRGDVERLRRAGLIASNHQSAWDTIVFFGICDRPTYAMKKELMAIPIYGWLSRRQGHIAVDRKAGASAIRRLQRTAQAMLAAGRQIVLFPQGTRVAPGERRRYQPGIAGLYQALGVPVTPVALNSGLFWPRRSFLKWPGKIVLEILPDIPPGLPRAEFLRTLEERIETASQHLIEESRAPAPIIPPFHARS